VALDTLTGKIDMNVAKHIKDVMESNLDAIESVFRENITTDTDKEYIDKLQIAVKKYKSQIQDMDKLPIQEVRSELKNFFKKFKSRKNGDYHKYIYLMLYSGYLHYYKNMRKINVVTD
jgi:hypothetical protein